MATIEINPETEAVYEKSQIEAILKQRDTLQRELEAVKKEQRMIYNDVKNIAGMIPMDKSGNVDLSSLMFKIGDLMGNPKITESFTGLHRFIEKFESTNVIVK
jgi:hypothetical protein